MRIFLLLVFSMTTSLAADLPHRVNELKLSKNQSIYTSLKLIYEEYTKSLLDLQTEFVAAGRLADSKSVQSEFFLNTGYLKLNGKPTNLFLTSKRPFQKRLMFTEIPEMKKLRLS